MIKMSKILKGTMAGAVTLLGMLVCAPNSAFASDPMIPYHARGTVQGIVDIGLSNPNEFPETLKIAFEKRITKKDFSRSDSELLLQAAQSGDRSVLLSALFWSGYIGDKTDRDWRREKLDVATTSFRGSSIVAVHN